MARNAVAVAREMAALKSAPISKEAKEALLADLVEELEEIAREAHDARLTRMKQQKLALEQTPVKGAK